MSEVVIRRIVENIRSGANIYTPLVELVVNAIQAIDQKAIKNGMIQVDILRSPQRDALDSLEDIDGFIVKDNGIGFTKSNRDSFDTLYTEQKISDGGKGFGRFTCLKYFNHVKVASTFSEDDSVQNRSFRMGWDKDIIVDEEIIASEKRETGTAVEISGIRSVKFPDKQLETISRVVVERLLPYFVDKDHPCPHIMIREAKEPSSSLSLNDYLGNKNSQIVEMSVDEGRFRLSANTEPKDFQVRVFKIFAPQSATSKIILVAHRREVTEKSLQNYIPEFAEGFFEPSSDHDLSKGRNFIIKIYVFSDYLNDNVSFERSGFRFQAHNDLLYGISQTQIEEKAAEIAQSIVSGEIVARKERKKVLIADYVLTNAPWHRILANEVDFDSLPMKPSNQEIEIHLQKKKYEKEIRTRLQVEAILKSENPNESGEKIVQIMENISDTSKNDLIHYVSMRKYTLDLLSKSLEIDIEGKYKSEGNLHDIIMLRKKDSEELDYEAHNLWILDERLNFSSYVSSDKPLGKSNLNRTDITIYNKRMAFRGENEASNPITIFEFKKPQHDAFANSSSKEDPVQQIVRYVQQIKEGRFDTPAGRSIIVNDTTLFYGYVVCDLTEKVKQWLKLEKEFTAMPDGLGWFRWFVNNRLYMEVLSWTKLLRDAEMRNKIFFKKLSID